jgi:hypothetical protein
MLSESGILRVKKQIRSLSQLRIFCFDEPHAPARRGGRLMLPARISDR